MPTGLLDHAVTPIRHVIYLHGFASSPESSKAQRFARELDERRVGFTCPDFNRPAFETLTVTRMLDQVDAALDAATGPVALVGSSLGGFVALHAAARRGGTDKIARLILLAPAIEFGGNRLRQLGEQGIAEWRRAGRMSVFHYAFNEPREIGFELYRDAAKYDAVPLAPAVPVLVFQGRRDDAVDPQAVERWARGKPLVDLRLMDDDHQLKASMDEIWAASARFLFGAAPP